MTHYASHFAQSHHISRIRRLAYCRHLLAANLFTEALCFRPTEQRHKDCAREVFKHHSFYRQTETPGIPQRVVRVSNRPDARRPKQGNFLPFLAVTQSLPH